MMKGFTPLEIKKKYGRDYKSLTGFTFIEVLAVIIISLIVMAGIFVALSAGRQSWFTGSAQVELQQETRRAMDTMVKELRQCIRATIVGVPNDGFSYPAITFQMPEDIDNDGDVIAADGSLEQGSQITYLLGGLNGDQILRTSAGFTAVLANKIINLKFKRPLGTLDIMQVSLHAEKNTLQGRLMQSGLRSQVGLRN